MPRTAGFPIEGVGVVSPEPFVFDVAKTALEHQLERFRDVLTLSLGLIAAALAGIAFMVVEKATNYDMAVGVVLTIGGVIALLAIVCWSDPLDAPNPQMLAEAFDHSPLQMRVAATGSVLMAINKNKPHLRTKFLLAKLSLFLILGAATFGVCLKVVELEGHGQDQVRAGARVVQSGFSRGYQAPRRDPKIRRGP
jgi:hypothetical protein